MRALSQRHVDAGRASADARAWERERQRAARSAIVAPEPAEPLQLADVPAGHELGAFVESFVAVDLSGVDLYLDAISEWFADELRLDRLSPKFPDVEELHRRAIAAGFIREPSTKRSQFPEAA